MPNIRQLLILGRFHKPFSECFPHLIPAYSSHYREYPIGLRQAASFVNWLNDMGIKASVSTRLPLKILAEKAGLGIFRRNSLIYSRSAGSFMILYGILLDTEIGPGYNAENTDTQQQQTCGECRVCIDKCPTGAILSSGGIDLSKCIRNYMGSGCIAPVEIRDAYGVRLLGCEICQRVCPYNDHVLQDLSLPSDEELKPFSLVQLLDFTNPSHKKTRKDIAQVIGNNYARKNRLLTDAVIAAGNTKDPALLDYLKETLQYPYTPVRVHSAWAIGKIGTAKARTILTTVLKGEEDSHVKSEIILALDNIY